MLRRSELLAELFKLMPKLIIGHRFLSGGRSLDGCGLVTVTGRHPHLFSGGLLGLGCLRPGGIGLAELFNLHC
jgi:hypothetical protein